MNVERGRFSLNLGIVKLEADLQDQDRQCAWELYTEISTRVSVVGKKDENGEINFDGELYIESLQSLYNFFQESRNIMKKFPIGKISKSEKNHLGSLIFHIIEDVLRPFLETWQVKYRDWWEIESNPRKPPLERQKEFPEINEFLEEWKNLRSLMREVQKELAKQYRLPTVS